MMNLMTHVEAKEKEDEEDQWMSNLIVTCLEEKEEEVEEDQWMRKHAVMCRGEGGGLVDEVAPNTYIGECGGGGGGMSMDDASTDINQLKR